MAIDINNSPQFHAYWIKHFIELMSNMLTMDGQTVNGIP